MGRLFLIKTIIFTVIGLILLVGCVPETRKADVVYGPGGQEAPVVSIPLLEERIASLRNILEQGTLDENDRKMARELLVLYEEIRRDSLRTPPRYEYPQMSRRLLGRLMQLDERYYSGGRPAGVEGKDVISRFSAARKRILDYYLYGNYQGVMDECLKLESELGPEFLTPEIGLVFALSLAKKGMLKEAIGVGEKIASRLEGKPDLMDLQARITEWHVMLGQKEKAEQSYEKLVDSLNTKQALFKRTERKLAAGPSPELIPEKPRMTPSDTLQGDAGSLENVLKRADALIENKQFHEAKMLLVTYRITLPEGPEMEAIDQALKRVDFAEQEYLDDKRAQRSHFQEGVARAKTLIDEEKFEEALQELEKLEVEQPGGAEVKALKETATEKLIQQERNKAAKLYLMARNTSDPGKKEELLLASYNKLKVLIEKYPSSSLNNTLNNNIIKVRDELRKLGVDPG
jgi:tetratricopeptide (TPR) repeat protein